MITRVLLLAAAVAAGAAIPPAHAQGDAKTPAAGVAPGGKPLPTSVTADGITLRSVDVALPWPDRTFPGAATAITDNCSACHSAGMVLTQPAMSPAAWQAEIDKMRGTFKAPIADADVAAILAYLVANKGAR